MKVLVLAGGSGGHVTPAVAVIHKLTQHSPEVEVRVWCDRRYAPQCRSLVHSLDNTIPVQTILCGKIRRYYHLAWWQHLTSPSVIFPNIRDIFLVIGGFLQSCAKFAVWRPDVVFAKGGFVSVPAGIVAWVFKIPLVIHDSDSRPGLANRILAHFASYIATGTPLSNYPYDRKVTHYTGIPIHEDFHPYKDADRQKVKARLGFAPDKPLVVITGGGLGAGRLNDAVTKQLTPLLALSSILLLSGTGHYAETHAHTPHDDKRFRLIPFADSREMAQLLGAADIVVSRAGATTILELSALAKPTILVPAAQLAGGHQIKNAAECAKAGVAEIIDDDALAADPQMLLNTISSLLANPAKRSRMAQGFYALTKPHAAEQVVQLIERAATKKS